jgi:hexulose-6-phosphate isomerase
MKKAICLGSVVPRWDLEKRIALIKEAGYDGFESHHPGSEDEAKQIKALAEKYGLVVHSLMGGTHWQFPLSAPDPETRKKGIEGIEQALNFAAIMGAEGVLVVPAVVNEATDYKTAWELSMQSLQQLIPVAKRLGVQIWVENVWNRFLLSPLEFAAYIDELNSKANSDGDGIVGAYFDVGNILAYGFPQHWIRLLGKRIKRIHVKDENRCGNDYEKPSLSQRQLSCWQLPIFRAWVEFVKLQVNDAVETHCGRAGSDDSNDNPSQFPQRRNPSSTNPRRCQGKGQSKNGMFKLDEGQVSANAFQHVATFLLSVPRPVKVSKFSATGHL